MLRTSSQEGGLQQRTESPKATSGAPNGFVRPVAVASIFRPALGGTGEVSGVDGKLVVPENRRSSAAKDCKVFGSSLSSSEFSRRRQSFDTKNAISLSPNALKQASENRSSPDRTLVDLESVPESIDKVSIPNGESDEHLDVSRNLSKIQSASVKNSKGGDRLVGTNTAVKSSGVLGNTTSNITEGKDKNTENASLVRSAKASKVSLPPSGSDLKVSFTKDDNDSVIPNGLLGDCNTPAVVTRPRSRNSGAAECVQTPPTPPQSERRRRSKISGNTYIDTESVSSSLTALDSTASVTKDRLQSEETISKTQSVTSTECVQQHGERRRRVRPSQDTCTEQKRDLSDLQIVEKNFSAKNESESSSNKNSEEAFALETKCELQIDAKKGVAPTTISSEKRDSVETLDAQSVSKYRTYRRTSDVIAAKIQTIFSKSDHSSNKLSSFKGKSCAILTEKESKIENLVTEKVNIQSSEAPKQNIKDSRNLTKKEESPADRKNISVNCQTAQVSSDESQLNKRESANAKTQQSVKHIGTDKASRNVSSLKTIGKTPSELGNNVVHNDISISSSNRETCGKKICVKDSKPSCNKNSNDSISSLSVQSTVNTITESNKKSTGNTSLTKNEQKPTATTRSPDFSSVNEGNTTSSVAKKPVASLNFFITEVSIENSPNTQKKIGSGKASALQVETKQPSENVQQKYQQTSDLKKTSNDNSKVKTVASKSETVNVEVITSKFPDKNKVNKSVLEKEGNKLASENQPLKLSEVNKTTAKKTASGDAKTLSVTVSEPVNSGAVVLKPSEKEKRAQVLQTNEGNKAPSEYLQQKNILVQKLNTEKNTSSATKTESFTSCKLVNFGVQFLKPVEKDKASKALPSKESKVLPENSSQKFTPLSTEEKNSSVDKAHKTCSSEVLKSPEKDKTDKAVLSKEGNKAESENLRQNISQIEKSGAGENTVGRTKAQNITNIESPKESSTQELKPADKGKTEKPLPLKGGIKASSENLQQKISLIGKTSSTKLNKSGDAKFPSVTGLGSTITSSTYDLNPLENCKTDHTPSKPTEGAVKISENSKQKSVSIRKLDSESNATDDTKVQNCTSSEVLTTVSGIVRQPENDNTSQSSQIKENKVLPETSNKRSSVFQKWGAKEKTSGSAKVKKVADLTSPKLPSGGSTCKTAPQKSEMPSENVKQKLGTVEKLGADEPARDDSHRKNTACKAESADSTKINDNRAQHVEVKTKTLGTVRNAEQQLGEEYKAFSKVQNAAKQEQKLDDNAKYAEVRKITSLAKKVTTSVVSSAESAVKPVPSEVVQTIKKAENAEIIARTQSPTTKKIEKQEGVMKDTNSSVEGVNKSKSSAPSDIQPSTKDADSLAVSTKYEVKEPVVKASISLESSSFKSTALQGMMHNESGLVASDITALEKDSDDSGIFASTGMPSSTRSSSSSILNFEFPSRSSSLSKFETPRPPERKRSGFLREMSTLPPPPPRVPLRSVTRTGSLKRPDDYRLPTERTFSVLRSSSQSTMLFGQQYTPQQRISYTEMLSKLGTSGHSPSLTATNRKFNTSQVSELWADLGEEQSNTAHTSEMFESETSERMRLEKEVQELQSRYSQMQQKSDKMEMEMMEARVYRTTEVNGDLSEDEENDATASIYKKKYERAVRDMEIMKRRLQQQHEEEIEQSSMLKKAADKRLTEALEDVEEERQVVNQWKRKAQKLGSELQDLRLMLEEQMARNGELEKKQRRFDAELSAAQEDIRKEHQLREKLTRERDQAQLEKYSLEQEIQATRLDMDMQHEKIAILNRELDELSLSSKGEEEVTQLKRAKQELERKTRDQEEELEELAGQVQMLEQAKLRLEMSLEKLRQEHRRESSVRDEEIEEIRASSSKKIKNLEAQLENEQEERHQLVKQKHELERRIIELSDQPPPQDPEVERRLRRDLKRTKALLRDAQSMLEHMRDGQANKTLIRQLKNQLEDAEFTKSVALKARQTAELELQELQSQLEEVTRTKNDVESRCLQVSREKSALHAQLEEMEEEMAEVMKKYKAAVAQMSIDQKSLAEQNQQISELENERLALKEQLAEVSTKLDHISVQTEDSGRVHRLDAKVRDLESKLELEQTTRSRLEHQIARLKEQCDRSREECDSLRSKELQAQEGSRRLQRQLRELREDYANLQQKESEAYRKQHELEMALENTEADLQVTKNDLRLACQRIQDLQNALEDDLDSGTDVPDDSGSDTDSSLDVSVLSRQCLTPLHRSDSVSSNTSIGSDGRQFRTVSHSQDMAFFSRMMQRRTSTDFLI